MHHRIDGVNTSPLRAVQLGHLCIFARKRINFRWSTASRLISCNSNLDQKFGVLMLLLLILFELLFILYVFSE